MPCACRRQQHAQHLRNDLVLFVLPFVTAICPSALAPRLAASRAVPGMLAQEGNELLSLQLACGMRKCLPQPDMLKSWPQACAAAGVRKKASPLKRTGSPPSPGSTTSAGISLAPRASTTSETVSLTCIAAQS